MDPLKAEDPNYVGGYRLLERLGRGGMGQVFLAETPGRRKVAVKLIRPEFADDPDFRLRFAREVAAARQVGGFHTALVIDADADADPAWMVTAYIPGPSLAGAVVEHGPFQPDAILDLGAALAEGLSAIHDCGLVHRDFKPSNIILGDDGPRILDFGIARSASATTITPEGVHIGTVQYMSPEHLGAGDITAASDVFSLGSVLAFAATGRGPFDALEDVAIMGRILAHDPVLGSLETPLRDVIGACLTKDPAKRPTLRALLDYFAAPGGTLIPSPDKAQPSAKWDNTAPQWSLPLTVTMGSADELANARPAGIRFARVQESQRPASADAMGSAKADDGDPPRRSVRILSPDVRLRLWEIRAAIMAVGFFVAAALLGAGRSPCQPRLWPASQTPSTGREPPPAIAAPMTLPLPSGEPEGNSP